MYPNNRTYRILSISLLLIPLVAYFIPLLNPLNILQYYQLQSPQIFRTIAPFAGYNRIAPAEWDDKDGIPLFYEAWRAKAGSQTSEPTKRSSLLRYGSHVACWPSTGGVWTNFALGPDLDFLVLPRQDVNRTWPYDAQTEDVFCQKLRLIGASFYELPLALTTFDCGTLEECVLPSSRKENLGFVWREDGALAILNLTIIKREYGPGLGGWSNACDMEGRCRIANLRSRLYEPWCHVNPDRCRSLWCAMYPNYCQEVDLLPLVSTLPDVLLHS
jgi:hypothetical protein